MPLDLLVVSSETPDQQDSRRRRSGQASHETYADALHQLAPDAGISHRCCVDGTSSPEPAALRRHDGVLFAGSPIQMHEKTVETRAAAAFMHAVYESGVPAFGSCAGLQIAAVAAGGAAAPRDSGMEAGFARGIVATDAGRTHPMLRCRPLSWNAPAMHSTVVERLPSGATLLARSDGTHAQAAEIRVGKGVFWGVQYHPELALWEIGDALRAQADALMETGLAQDEEAVARYAGALDALHDNSGRDDLAWQLGLDAEVTDPQRRRREISNFLAFIAERV